MRRPKVRDDVAVALADARGARQATLILWERVRALASDIERLDAATSSFAALRLAVLDHIDTHHGVPQHPTRTALASRRISRRSPSARRRRR